MTLFKNPKWLNQYMFPYRSFEEIPSSVFKTINGKLASIQSDKPLASIIIICWNEEVNILRTIASLSGSKTEIPIEIIVVNNNSTDKTQQTLDQLHLKSVFQEIQGWGPARQMGMEKAKGKYILMADADCYYPEGWVNKMIQTLQIEEVVCVYGRYSFLSGDGYPRWKLFVLEKLKNIIADIRHYKRPYLNAYGMSMGFIREYGLKVGYVMHKIRGEDGRMCFDLMKYGKVKQVKAKSACVWTGTRALQRDGNFSRALQKRVLKEVKRFTSMFFPHPPHDTKTSTND